MSATPTEAPADRVVLERAAAEARDAARRARLLADHEDSLAREADLALARLDAGPGASEEVVLRLGEVRSALADTGHPVLDALVLPARVSRHETRERYPLVRVEFLYERSRVGVLRYRLEREVFEVATRSPVPNDGRRLHDLRLAELPAGEVGAGPLVRNLASNDDLRVLRDAPARARTIAALLVSRNREDAAGGVGGENADGVLSLLALEETGARVALAISTPLVLGVVRDLAVGVPEEWAVRRLTGRRS